MKESSELCRDAAMMQYHGTRLLSVSERLIRVWPIDLRSSPTNVDRKFGHQHQPLKRVKVPIVFFMEECCIRSLKLVNGFFSCFTKRPLFWNVYLMCVVTPPFEAEL